MSHEVWIARDGDGGLFQYHQKPEYDCELRLYKVSPEKFFECISRNAFPFLKPGECIKFVAAERFVNGEPVSEGEMISVRIAVVANAGGDYSASGWNYIDKGQPGDALLIDSATEGIEGDNLSRTIVTARVPVPKVSEVQGVVEGTVTP